MMLSQRIYCLSLSGSRARSPSSMNVLQQQSSLSGGQTHQLVTGDETDDNDLQLSFPPASSAHFINVHRAAFTHPKTHRCVETTHTLSTSLSLHCPLHCYLTVHFTVHFTVTSLSLHCPLHCHFTVTSLSTSLST